jgi:hypothetical protein
MYPDHRKTVFFTKLVENITISMPFTSLLIPTATGRDARRTVEVGAVSLQ